LPSLLPFRSPPGLGMWVSPFFTINQTYGQHRNSALVAARYASWHGKVAKKFEKYEHISFGFWHMDQGKSKPRKQ
jgi:hypothetical protein